MQKNQNKYVFITTIIIDFFSFWKILSAFYFSFQKYLIH